jgi:hypothetical protein
MHIYKYFINLKTLIDVDKETWGRVKHYATVSEASVGFMAGYILAHAVSESEHRYAEEPQNKKIKTVLSCRFCKREPKPVPQDPTSSRYSFESDAEIQRQSEDRVGGNYEK